MTAIGSDILAATAQGLAAARLMVPLVEAGASEMTPIEREVMARFLDAQIKLLQAAAEMLKTPRPADRGNVVEFRGRR